MSSRPNFSVLHVDDEPEFAALTATFLNRDRDRFDIMSVTSAEDGLEQLEQTDFDCIVSDFDMPGTSGIEFLEHVRARNPDVPFILFTGKGSEEVASDAISAGASDYLQKGSGGERFSLLANSIENLVSKYRAETHLRTRARQQQSVAELGKEALGGVPLQQLFDHAFQLVATTLDNEYAKILEYRPEHGALLFRSGVGWREELVGDGTVDIGDDSQAGHTIRAEEPIIVDDLRTDERFRGPPLLVDHGVVSGLSVIIGSVDDPWGVLGTHTTHHTVFTDDDITFIQNIANVLANAIERVNREEALARSEARYRAVAENFPNGLIALFDDELRYEFVHGGAFDNIELTPAMLEGNRVQDIFPDEVSNRLVPKYQAALNGEYSTFEMTFQDRLYRVHTVPIEPDTRGMLMSQDVTEATEDKQQLETLLDNFPGYIYRHQNEPGWPLEFVKGMAEEITGYSAEELVEDMTIAEEIIHTDDREYVAAEVKRALEEDEPFTLVYRINSKDGEQRWIWERGRLVEDPVSGEEMLEGFIIDYTSGKERELEREATIDFLQSLYEVATHRTLTADEKISQLLRVGSKKLDLPYGILTRIERANESSQTGTQTVIEASGDHDLLRPGESCPLPQSYCRKTIETDGLLEIEDALAAGWKGDPAYEAFGLNCYIGSMITVDGELYGTVFFASDTARKSPFTDSERTFVRLMSQLVSYELEHREVTAEMERDNERLERFANIVSHDLKNPLNVAAGRLELAREEHDSEHLAEIKRAHDRMSELINNLLHLTIEGKSGFETESVVLSSLVETCWQTEDNAEATLQNNLSDRVIQANRSQLQQLLENLIRNSVKHAGDDVTVTTGELHHGFFVEDDGPGIPEDERIVAFEAGYSTASDGNGFGLAIVQQVADTHDWELTLTDGSNGGARFEFTGVT